MQKKPTKTLTILLLSLANCGPAGTTEEDCQPYCHSKDSDLVEANEVEQNYFSSWHIGNPHVSIAARFFRVDPLKKYMTVSLNDPAKVEYRGEPMAKVSLPAAGTSYSATEREAVPETKYELTYTDKNLETFINAVSIPPEFALTYPETTSKIVKSQGFTVQWSLDSEFENETNAEDTIEVTLESPYGVGKAVKTAKAKDLQLEFSESDLRPLITGVTEFGIRRKRQNPLQQATQAGGKIVEEVWTSLTFTLRDSE